MKYLVTVNGERTAVEVNPDGATAAGTDAVSQAPGVPATLDAAAANGPVRVLRFGDRVVRVIVASRSGRGAYTLDIDGRRYDVEALDERTAAIREMTARTAAPSGPAPVLAPMPGLVVRVNVAPGDAVAAGQGVLVMEAMKMENELRASAAGTVKAVRVQPGTAVDKGTVLVELE